MSLKEPLMQQKLPQMTFLGLFRCKQTFSRNVATFRQIESFSTSAQYLRKKANMSTFCISAQFDVEK